MVCAWYNKLIICVKILHIYELHILISKSLNHMSNFWKSSVISGNKTTITKRMGVFQRMSFTYKKELIIELCFVLFCFVIFSVQVFRTVIPLNMLHGDVFGRSYMALEISHDGIIHNILGSFTGFYPYQWLAWLPLPFYLQAVVMRINGDPIGAGRIISIVATYITLFFMFKIIRISVHSLFIRIMAYCLLFFSHMVQFWAQQGISEPLFSALFIGSVYYLLKLATNQKKLYIVMFSLLFNLCSLVRYESWDIIPFLIVHLFYIFGFKNVKRVILTSFSLFVSPVIWCLVNYSIKNNPLFFIHEEIDYALTHGTIQNQRSTFHVLVSGINAQIPYIFLILGILMCANIILFFKRKIKIVNSQIVVFTITAILLGSLTMKIYNRLISYQSLFLYLIIVLVMLSLAELTDNIYRRSPLLAVIIIGYLTFYIMYQNTTTFPVNYFFGDIRPQAEKILQQHEGKLFVFTYASEKDTLILTSKINNYCAYRCMTTNVQLSDNYYLSTLINQKYVFIANAKENISLPGSKLIYKDDIYSISAK